MEADSIESQMTEKLAPRIKPSGMPKSGASLICKFIDGYSTGTLPTVATLLYQEKWDARTAQMHLGCTRRGFPRSQPRTLGKSK